MRYLLDTHILLWWDDNDARLDSLTRARIEDADSTLYLSIASAWELSIKIGRGKLNLEVGLLDDALAAQRISWLPVELKHCEAYTRLPMLHRDPFDRMLVAQAQSEGLILLSADHKVLQYPGIDGSGAWQVMDAARDHPYRTRRRSSPSVQTPRIDAASAP